MNQIMIQCLANNNDIKHVSLDSFESLVSAWKTKQTQSNKGGKVSNQTSHTFPIARSGRSASEQNIREEEGKLTHQILAEQTLLILNIYIHFSLDLSESLGSAWRTRSGGDQSGHSPHMRRIGHRSSARWHFQNFRRRGRRGGTHDKTSTRQNDGNKTRIVGLFLLKKK